MKHKNNFSLQIPKRMRACAGFSAAEVMITGALILATPVIALAMVRYEAFGKEIDAEQYAALQKVAQESCTGAAHLKSIAGRGPILGKEFVALRDDLEDRAKKQKAQDARSKIVRSAGVCA